MQRLPSTSAGVSKERVWPSNARIADRGMLQEPSPWQHKESGDASVSMEMGLPTHEDTEENGLPKHKPYVGLGGRR